MRTLTASGEFFFEMAGDAFAILENGQFIRVNRAWSQILGRPANELIDRHWIDLFDAENAEKMLEAMASAASNEGRFSDVEARVRDADESDRWLVWNGYTDSGVWLLSARDVTERRRTLEKIELQAQLLDAVDAALVASDLRGTITEWSAGAERMFGWTAEEVVGDLIMAKTVSSKNASHASQILQLVQREGRWERELELERKDGTIFPALVRYTLYHAKGGDPAGFVGVAVDLTEQVEARRTLGAANGYRRPQNAIT